MSAEPLTDMTTLVLYEVVIAGMTFFITNNLDEAIAKCNQYPGSIFRTALGHS